MHDIKTSRDLKGKSRRIGKQVFIVNMCSTLQEPILELGESTRGKIQRITSSCMLSAEKISSEVIHIHIHIWTTYK